MLGRHVREGHLPKMKARISFIMIGIGMAATAQPAATPAAEKPIKTKIVLPAEGNTAPKVAIVPTPDEEAPQMEAAIPAPEAVNLNTLTNAAAVVADAVPAPVKALGPPAMMSFPGGIVMAVTASSEKAQAHVLQGLNHLHGGWEFEASRHFAAAMQEDPDCLLAHWGMIMTALAPTPETGPARDVTADRLLDLVDQGKGTELERGYAYALIKYLQDGPAGAARAFRQVAGKFPNEMMAAIFAALFDRTGYDELGTATPAQEMAESILTDLIKKHPESPLAIHALLTIRAEAPDLSASLPLARQLCQMAPDYPPYFHLLGHYEWRCGEHGKAAAAFGKAASFYQAWMKANGTTLADCPEWVKAECYRAICMASKGDFDNAYATARQLAATPLPAERVASPGARILLWDAKTLPARLLLHRGLRGNAGEALASMAKPQEIKQYHASSLAYWWIDGLRLALEARRLIDAGDLAQAKDVSAAMAHHGEAMAKAQSAASGSGERSEWVRSFRALEVLASDIRGRIALAGPKSEIRSAYNWFSSAADRQRPSPALFPPLILTPMPLRVGDYFMAVNRPADAIEAYLRALALFPNDMDSLIAIKSAYQLSNLGDQAKAIELRIQELQRQ